MATPSQTNDSADEKLSVALLNINGLRNKTLEVQHIIAHHKLHVVALCETKLDDSVKDSKVYIPGFRMWRRDRTKKSGGGVALYVQDHIEAHLRSDLMETEVEIIWVEMKLPGSRPVLLGCCYRPPHKDAEYLFQYNKIMSTASKEKEEKDILLMGDFNTDWKLEFGKNPAGYVLPEWGLTQIVKKDTKFAKKSSTCIDHIYTNIPDPCSEPKSIPSGCTDHNLVTVTVNKKIPQRIGRTFRSKLNICKVAMMWAPWKEVYKEFYSDPEKVLDKFTEILLSVADKHAPLTKHNIYNTLIQCITQLGDDIQKLISERDKAERERIEIIQNYKSKELTSESDQTEIVAVKKKVTSKNKKVKNMIRAKQKTLYQEQLKMAKTDPKQLLKLFEEYLGNSLSFCVINITQDGAMASQAEQMEKLHQIYTGYTDLESVIKGSHVQPQNRRTDGFNFEKIDPETIDRLLEYICDHVTHGIDETEAELMKFTADHICRMLNRFRLTGAFPEALKKIKTFPFSGNNYIYSRPDCRNDSVHIMLGYIFDLILYLQARQFLTVNNLIPSLTPRDEMKETETAWLTASEANRTVGAVFLDFSSAFNTISHDLLINKLRTSGFSDSALQLIGNFLSYHEGSSGLPRGSYLAELLFIVFISDMKADLTKPAVICNSYMMIYAHGDSQTLKSDLYHETTSACGWVKPFNITFDETRPELIKPRMMSDIFQILESLSRCHGDKLNWIRALKDIVQHCSVWHNPKIRETLEEYFGKRCLVSVPAKVMEDVINSLRLSRPDLRGF